MLEQFKGEVFHHPAALEYSGNTCSHQCAYCFANSRCEDRRYSIVALSKLCLGKSNSDSLASYLFNRGHAVCISNRTDPFGLSNADNTPAVLELMDLVTNGVYFQTKGVSDSRNWDLLDRFKKRNVVMYITISGVRDDILKRIEPGAPIYNERVRLAKYAKSRGWDVVIGLNPCWEKWLGVSEIDDVVAEMRSVGINDFFVEPLGMLRTTYNKLNAARRERMPEDEICGAFNKYGEDIFYAFRQVARLHRKGVNVYTQGFPRPTKYGIDGYRLLGKVINPVYLFTNWAYAEHARTGRNVFTFSDFISVLLKGNEELIEYHHHDFYKYIMCVHRGVWKSGGLAKRASSLLDVYRVCWNDQRMYHSPQKLPCFYTIGRNGIPELDDKGNVVLKFLGEAGVGSRRKQVAPADELGGKEVY